ncbi:hypothetical protein [Reyranella sp. CPCC 100927]|uniref:hypothetical protein n=1 Tax=Reyranella sp. CPCC 100927 TaxID=2599616 RepID=UPI0011B71CBB|nr:hypothetical protein [Reyranella sp. CPCC 100927]TWT09977.1 hypothetical protein FQU96_17940 [Reyranella sp. CPCC 100927]
MAAGWVILIELEAGRGELEPLLFAVAVEDHREAMAAARQAPDVVQPRAALQHRAPTIHDVRLVGSLSRRTIDRLGLAVGDVWRL